jgi:hypothetical protein
MARLTACLPETGTMLAEKIETVWWKPDPSPKKNPLKSE